MVIKMTDNYNIQIPAQARDVAAMATELFGERLCGVYLYGSAVLGGLRPDSDIDILIIIDGGLDDALRAELTKRLLKLSVTVAVAHSEQRGLRPLEITVLDKNQLRPRRFPPRIEYLYGEWLRDEIEAGELPMPHASTDLVILLRQSERHSLRLYGRELSELADPIPDSDVKRAMRAELPKLAGYLHGDERNVLLTYCRMWYTLANGDIVSKDTAAEWALARLEPELRRPIEVARQAYLGIADDSGKYEGADRLAVYFEEKISELLK